MADRFSSREDIAWHTKAYDAGMRARREGMTQADAPRRDVGGEHYRKSWLAGWADQDQIYLSEGQ